MADGFAEADQSTARGLALQVSHPADFAARCLAVGIGLDCGGVIDELACAPWFAHLRGTAIGSCSLTGKAGCPHEAGFLRFLEAMLPLHIASVALPAAPTSAEFDLACELGRFLRRHRAFVVMTSALAPTEFLGHLIEACDCFVHGDGGPAHHQYPIRTVAEPASGRLVCYDLYDACSLWAGRVGEYGALNASADALHVEISSTVTTLEEVDALATGFADRLDNPDNLLLFNVVNGLGPTTATPVSFSAR
jgi:hypothetical protein